MRNPASPPNVRAWLTVLAGTMVAFVIVALLGFPAWGGGMVFVAMPITAVIYVAVANRRRRR